MQLHVYATLSLEFLWQTRQCINDLVNNVHGFVKKH